jgi:hypothetical protein
MDTGWDIWTRFWIHPSSTIHLALDVGGMSPGMGIVFDLVNAGLYLFEGDLVNAGVAAGAAIPVFGQGVTAGKLLTAGGTIGVIITKSKRLPNKLARMPNAEGAHTVFRIDPSTGRISNYETFDSLGLAGGNRRFRGTGKPHGGHKPPISYEPIHRYGPDGKPTRARPARPEEIPLGH